MEKKRFIWEEILPDPWIIRVREAGKQENAYLLLSDGEALAIDPRSGQMLQSMDRIRGGFGPVKGPLQVFLTDGCLKGDMAELLQETAPGTAVYCAEKPFPAETPGLSQEPFPAEAVDLAEKPFPAEAVDPGSGSVAPETADPAGEQVSWVQVSDGDGICLGRARLQCVRTEGHARGLTSLWLAQEGILFSGDAIGVDELPEVPLWDDRIDTMGLQLETLRRLRALPVRVLLPGRGAAAGPEDCAALLDRMESQYCIRILEVYQKVPSRGGIREEDLERRTGGRSTGSCCKYLLYRKYIRRKDDGTGMPVYERGSMLLTDWNLRKNPVGK